MTTPPETPRADPSRPDDPGAKAGADAVAVEVEGGASGGASAAFKGEPSGRTGVAAGEPAAGVGAAAVSPGESAGGVGAAEVPAGSVGAAVSVGETRASRRDAVLGEAGDGAVTAGEGRPSENDAVLGKRTYDRILEPRSQRRLPLGDGTWHQLARAYVRVQLITQGAVIVLVLAAAVAAQVITGVRWQWIPAGVILLVTLIGLVITPRQARSFGYQLRRDDLVFRRGILWQRVVAVPYGRMQLVDITHGPLDRGFGIAQLKLVTAAASTGVTIPGLTQEAAEHLRDTLVAVAETRRTGL